eukprot:gene15376-16956_t
MIEAIVLLKSLWTRILFFAHGFFSIYLASMYFGNSLIWIISLGMVFLLIEMFYTLKVRKGQEYKYFWPSGFLYIITIAPIIWIFDMEALDLLEFSASAKHNKFMGMSKEDVARLIFELGLIFGIILGRWLMPRGKLTRDQLSALLLGYVGTAADIVELKVETEIEESGKVPIKMAVLGAYTWSLFQFTLMTTATQKGKEQEEQEAREKATKRISLSLGHYNKIAPESSASGFTRKDSEKRLTRSSTISESRGMKEMTAKEKYIESIKRQRVKTMDSSMQYTRKKYSAPSKPISPLDKMPHNNTKSFDAEADKKTTRMRKLHGELFQILVTLLMQDGPFLILRLVLLIEFKVSTEMHILFMAKNAMVCTLLVYRLCILTCREESDNELQKEQAASKLHNVQLAVMGASIMRSNVADKQRKLKNNKLAKNNNNNNISR